MKSKEFKRYCEDFPFLSAVVNRVVGKSMKDRPNAEDVAFIAVRPWENLDINNNSHMWPIGEQRDGMYGQIRYHVIWKANNGSEEWYHQNGIYDEVSEIIHVSRFHPAKKWEVSPERFQNIAQRIQFLQAVFDRSWSGGRTSAHIEAVVRIAWTGVHNIHFRSPLCIEIYRYPKQ